MCSAESNHWSAAVQEIEKTRKRKIIVIEQKKSSVWWMGQKRPIFYENWVQSQFFEKTTIFYSIVCQANRKIDEKKFEKSCPKIWSYQKSAVILHPQFGNDHAETMTWKIFRKKVPKNLAMSKIGCNFATISPHDLNKWVSDFFDAKIWREIFEMFAMMEL